MIEIYIYFDAIIQKLTGISIQEMIHKIGISEMAF